MNAKKLEEVVSDMLIKFGPDGHCDGAEFITDFILSLSAGNADEWISEHLSNNDQG